MLHHISIGVLDIDPEGHRIEAVCRHAVSHEASVSAPQGSYGYVVYVLRRA